MDNRTAFLDTTDNLSVALRWTVNVTVMPKAGVNDPEGQAIAGGLASLGYADVSEVRAGRFFQVTIAAPDMEAAKERVITMCEQLLANPVIESYAVSVQTDPLRSLSASWRVGDR